MSLFYLELIKFDYICLTCQTIIAGLLAKDPSTLRRVGLVLLQLPFSVQRNPKQILLADDCFELLKIPKDRISQVVTNSTERHFGSMFFLTCLIKGLWE